MAVHHRPLTALKAFEAAARHGSFVKAAGELGVTAPAVSQQVKGLETFLERKLFLRHNNRVVLTDAGRTIYPALAEGFDRLDEALGLVMEDKVTSRLAISTLPSLAQRWITRILGGFAAAEPDIRVDLRVEEDPVDFAGSGLDLRICYGAQLYPELAVEPLILDHVLPLCSREFLDAKGPAFGSGSLEDRDLIHTDWGPAFASLPGWSDWFRKAHPSRQPEVGQGFRVGQSSLAVSFALAGMGVALGQRLLAEEEIEQGRLVSPFGPSLPLGAPYCLVYPQVRAQSPSLRRLLDWIRARVGSTA
jgi:LysR family glycine cleavage system transcriptional activator